MKVQVFAVLKDYFEGEFEVQKTPATVEDLKSQLCSLNPQAAEVLELSRFAVGDEFVANQYLLTENDTVFIIPPSSGG